MAIVKSELLKQLSLNYPNFLKKDLEKFTNINGKTGFYSGGNNKTPNSKENIKRKRWLIELEINSS